MDLQPKKRNLEARREWARTPEGQEHFARRRFLSSFNAYNLQTNKLVKPSGFVTTLQDHKEKGMK